MYSVQPGGLKIAADRGSIFIDSAMHPLSDKPHERYTSGMLTVGPFHDHAEIIEFIGEFRWNSVRFYQIGLTPVKRSAEVSAAGAALNAGIYHI